MPQETKYCHSSAIATFPFQGSGVEVVDESGTLWTWGGSAYLKPVGSRKDPITGLDVLDAGSRGVVLGSGLDFGATPIAPLHTFDAFDSTAITTAAQYYANIDAWAAALPQVTKTDLGVSSDGLAANHL